MPETTYITDPDDYCRTCGGEGVKRDREYRDGRMVNVSCTCWTCGGSGARSVRVDEVAA